MKKYLFITFVFAAFIACSKNNDNIVDVDPPSVEMLTESSFICKAEEGITVEVKTAKPAYFLEAHVGHEPLSELYKVCINENHETPYIVEHDLFTLEHVDAYTFKVTVNPCNVYQRLLFVVSSIPGELNGDSIHIESLIE